jgi:osmoprotectant transport system substrate-binding protein
MKHSKKIIVASTILVASLALTGCTSATGTDESAGNDAPLAGLTGTVGAKDFSEQYILGNMVSILLNENGAETDYKTIVGSANVRTALESGEFLGYWEYTGTSWLAYNEKDAPVAGVQAQYDAVKELDAANGVAWLDGAPFNNTYAFAIRSDKAKELGVTSLSDVAMLPVADQTFCVESEFAARPDGWEGVKTTYGMPDATTVTLDTGAIYSVTADGKSYFPVYQGAFTLMQTTLDEYPGIADIINELTALLTDQVMQTLNAQADVDGDDPADIARTFLVEQGLIKG